MNVRALRKVQEQILAAPKNFGMAYYFDIDPECGTVCCIAGYAVLNAKLMKEYTPGFFRPTPKAEALHLLGGPRYAAMHALRLDDRQASALFYAYRWPPKFFDAYKKAKTPRGRASVAARRIDHFIATKGE